MAATPQSLGYRMPAEWEPHRATWLSWPHNRESWPGHFENVPGIWAELTRALSPGEEVHILCGQPEVRRNAEELVGSIPNVRLHDIPTNDAWMRDHGPIFLSGPTDSEPLLIDWGYNAWGGKYPPFDLDNRVPLEIAKRINYRHYSPGIVLEGGSIDPNGQGTLLSTEQCLLNPNRNPNLSRPELERYLFDYLAARKVIWLGEGIVGDDTDGHIDELARFVGERTVVTAVEQDPTDENYHPLQDNLQRLQKATDADDRPLEVIELPMPRPMFCEGQRMPGSYCNFYIGNRVVIIPSFDDPADTPVRELFARLFPDRRIVPIRAVELIWGLGAFHCITQQQPLPH